MATLAALAVPNTGLFLPLKAAVLVVCCALALSSVSGSNRSRVRGILFRILPFFLLCLIAFIGWHLLAALVLTVLFGFGLGVVSILITDPLLMGAGKSLEFVVNIFVCLVAWALLFPIGMGSIDRSFNNYVNAGGAKKSWGMTIAALGAIATVAFFVQDLLRRGDNALSELQWPNHIFIVFSALTAIYFLRKGTWPYAVLALALMGPFFWAWQGTGNNLGIIGVYAGVGLFVAWCCALPFLAQKTDPKSMSPVDAIALRWKRKNNEKLAQKNNV